MFTDLKEIVVENKTLNGDLVKPGLKTAYDVLRRIERCLHD